MIHRDFHSVQKYVSIIPLQQQSRLFTHQPRTSLVTKLKKKRPDLQALLAPRQTTQRAQKLIQLRWKSWIHSSKARYISTSLLGLEAKQFSELARGFTKAGSSGQLASCRPSALLETVDYLHISRQEFIHRIDQRLLAAFYEYSYPRLSNSLKRLTTACQFSCFTWFPSTRGLDRSIHLHIYDTLDTLTSDHFYHEGGMTMIYCGNTRKISGKHSMIPTDIHSLNVILRQQQRTDTLILDLDNYNLDWRWTQAFLDTPLPKIHIRTTTTNNLTLLQQICNQRNEICTVVDHRRPPFNDGNTRLSTSMIQWNDIQQGDCIIVTSVKALLETKYRLERDYGVKCAVLLPRMPQNIQKHQIGLFNDQKQPFQVLLLTDSVEVPCQIHAERLIFRSVKKYKQDGVTYKPVEQLKSAIQAILPTQQIALFDETDLPFIQQAVLSASPLSLTQQALPVLPSKAIFESFCRLMPKEAWMQSKMEIFETLTVVKGNFTMSCWKNQKTIAKWLELYSLSFDQRWEFMNAPVDTSLASSKHALQYFAEAVVEKKPCELEDVLNLPTISIRSETLMSFVNQYHVTDWYSWFRLNYSDIFVSDETKVQKSQHQCQAKIEDCLRAITDRRRKLEQDQNMQVMATQLLGETTSRR